MKSFALASLLLSAGTNALVARDGTCCFGISASGPAANGTVDQLGDGQNRVAGSDLQAGTFCIDTNGAITDGQGRGCIITPETSQFQCDLNRSPLPGFSVASNGLLAYNGSTSFVICKTGGNGENVYLHTGPDVTECTTTTLMADNCKNVANSCGAPSSSMMPSSSVAPAPMASSPPAMASSPAPMASSPAPMASSPAPMASSSAPMASSPAAMASSPAAMASSPAPMAPSKSAMASSPAAVASSAPAIVPVPAPAPSVSTEATSSVPSTTIAGATTVVTGTTPVIAPASSKVESSSPVASSSAPAKTAPAPTTPAASSVYTVVPVPSGVAPSSVVTSSVPSAPMTPSMGTSSKIASTMMPHYVNSTSTVATTTASSTASSSSCLATTLTSGSYQYPHLIVPVSSESPNTASGTSYFGYVNSTSSTIFNFDIPADYSGKTCNLVFLFPLQSQLETSSYTFSGNGAIDFKQLSSAATESTTYSSVPGTETDFGTTTIAEGNSYVISSFACPASTSVTYEMSNAGSTDLEFFEDWNPSPLGLFITTC